MFDDDEEFKAIGKFFGKAIGCMLVFYLAIIAAIVGGAILILHLAGVV